MITLVIAQAHQIVAKILLLDLKVYIVLLISTIFYKQRITNLVILSRTKVKQIIIQ